ncbi:ABC transporter permease [Frigidibacter sp. ROC022]|uniref:ABC transporter permease n=1 Tax=Frigidibacter sp. ROC022 TaxID=2971796 RepID=UPI00215B5671|nr:ABC transporter permease [Frigidibacter sp. ROC022]MCR8723223.1 ABC transporter permease [Frigidibacter sp. ROC022]
MTWLLAALLIWPLAWGLNGVLVRRAPARMARVAVPLIFGLTVVFVWEALVRGFGIEPVILPAPSKVAQTFADNRSILWLDFVQTGLKGALAGWVIGAMAAVAAALLIDRSPFLTRGLLPIGNLVAVLPIVGIAPILVSWFGFDWQSKAAVVVAMVFFPILVNTVAGLAAADRMQRDLMRTYAAGWGATLWKLRLPAAMPFIFNGLKIGTTLALIGAIVAEYFGSKDVGMGFRITTAAGRLGADMVWAEIWVAALAGSVFYGLVALVERWATFWHPSQRG